MAQGVRMECPRNSDMENETYPAPTRLTIKQRAITADRSPYVTPNEMSSDGTVWINVSTNPMTVDGTKRKDAACQIF
jgi:hypothetical protein